MKEHNVKFLGRLTKDIEYPPPVISSLLETIFLGIIIFLGFKYWEGPFPFSELLVGIGLFGSIIFGACILIRTWFSSK